MLRLLLLYLAASFSSTPAHPRGNLTGNLDPDGIKPQSQPPTTTGDIGGGLDPDGRAVQPQSDLHGNLDPDG